MKRAGSGWEVDAWGGPVKRYELFDEYAPYRSYEYEADFGIDVYYDGAKVAELDYDRLEGDSQPALYDMLESAYMRNVDMGAYLDKYVPEIEAELRDCEETIEDEGYVDTDKRGWWSDAFSDGFGGLSFRMLTDSPIPDFSERRASVRGGAFDAPHASSADELAVLALRQSLEGENQAIYDYQNWVNQLPEGHPVREGLVDIMREERAHVGELQQMLFSMTADELSDFTDGMVEVAGSRISRTAATAFNKDQLAKALATGSIVDEDAIAMLAHIIVEHILLDEHIGDCVDDALRDVDSEVRKRTDNYGKAGISLSIVSMAEDKVKKKIENILSELSMEFADSVYNIKWSNRLEGGVDMRFAYTVKDNITGDIYDCETVGDLEDCLRDITPDGAPGYELIDDVAHMANDNYFVDLENALGVTITANRGRRGAARARRRKSAGMYDIPGGAIETYQDGGRWYARAFQYGEYVTGRCYGRSEEEAVNKCRKELSKWGFDVAGRRARRNAPRRASRRKVAVNGAAFSNGWMMYLDVRGDGSFDVTLYDPDGREIDYGKTFTAGDEDSLVRQLKGIMGWRAPMDADDDAKLEEMAAKAFGRYGRRSMRMRAANTNRRSSVRGRHPIRKHALVGNDTLTYIFEDIEREAPYATEKDLDEAITRIVEGKMDDIDFLLFAVQDYRSIDDIKETIKDMFIDDVYDDIDLMLQHKPSLIADEFAEDDMWY